MAGLISQPADQKPTLSMAHFTAGGALIIMYLVNLARQEELSGLPTRILYPAVDASSGGTLVASMLYGPNPVSAQEALERYVEGVKQILPYNNVRILKMLTANIINTVSDFLDPNLSDTLRLQDISSLCQQMKDCTPETLHEKIDALYKKAARLWPKHDDDVQVFRMCSDLAQEAPDVEALVAAVFTHSRARVKEKTSLSASFKKAVYATGNYITQNWVNNYLIDSAVQKQIISDFVKDARISDCHGSVFLASHDSMGSIKSTSFCIKAGLLNPESDRNVEVSEGNPTILDSTMGACAHPLAFPAHRSAEDKLLDDCGAWHTPYKNFMHLRRHLKQQTPDARIELFIFNTGNEAFEAADLQRRWMREQQLGIPGGIANGTVMKKIYANVMSEALEGIRDTQRHEDGIEDGIHTFNPRLIARDSQEYETFPALNPLDTRAENIQAILARAHNVTHHEDDEGTRLRTIRAVKNLHSIGYIDGARMSKIVDRITTFPVPLKVHKSVALPGKVLEEFRAELANRPIEKTKRYLSDAFTGYARHLTQIISRTVPHKSVSDNKEPRPEQLPPPDNVVPFRPNGLDRKPSDRKLG